MDPLSLTAVHVEGGLLPGDLIARLAEGDLSGQTARDFGLPRGARLTDEIAAAWSDARAYWEAFQRRLRRLGENDPATGPTREQWVIPLLSALGYQRVTYQRRAAIVDGVSFALSHRALAGDEAEGLPIHIEGCRVDLDARPPSGRPRLSPHSLLQEYLNRTEHLWGMVTNGYRLRVLRDNALMTRPAWDRPALKTPGYTATRRERRLEPRLRGVAA